jgi:hypothetical protein
LTAKTDAEWGNLPAIAEGHSQFPVCLAVIGQIVAKVLLPREREGVGR